MQYVIHYVLVVPLEGRGESGVIQVGVLWPVSFEDFHLLNEKDRHTDFSSILFYIKVLEKDKNRPSMLSETHGN